MLDHSLTAATLTATFLPATALDVAHAASCCWPLQRTSLIADSIVTAPISRHGCATTPISRHGCATALPIDDPFSCLATVSPVPSSAIHPTKNTQRRTPSSPGRSGVSTEGAAFAASTFNASTFNAPYSRAVPRGRRGARLRRDWLRRVWLRRSVWVFGCAATTTATAATAAIAASARCAIAIHTSATLAFANLASAALASAALAPAALASAALITTTFFIDNPVDLATERRRSAALASTGGGPFVATFHTAGGPIVFPPAGCVSLQTLCGGLLRGAGLRPAVDAARRQGLGVRVQPQPQPQRL